MDVIVVGSGRVGSRLAVLLSRNGHNVSIIDKNQAAFRSLGKDFNGRTIKGLGFDESILQQAGVDNCDVVAAVTNNDNTNIMTVEVARRLFNVQHVITRLTNTDRASAYSHLGIDYVSGTDLVAEEIFSKIESGHGNHLETFGDYEVMQFVMKTPDGRPMATSLIEEDQIFHVALIEHEGANIIPVPHTLLHEGDIILAIIRQDKLDHYTRYMKERSL